MYHYLINVGKRGNFMDVNLKSKRNVIQSIALSILINGIVPVLVYNWLLGYFSSFISLLIATCIPLAENLYQILKYRKADAFGMLMLTGFILSLLAFLLGGKEQMILLRESVVTGIIGLIFIGSLFVSRPLIYHLAIRFSSNGEVEQKTKYEKNWENPYFRYAIRLMTAVWGIALLGDAIIRVFLVFELSISAFLAVSQILFYTIIGGTILWTVLYRRYAASRLN